MGLEIERLKQQLHAGNNTALADKAADLSLHLQELASTIHDMCRDLHSTKLDHLGLRAALNELCGKVFQHSGIVVSLEVGEDADRLPKEVARCLFRVAQEALNNTSKHSGAHSAQVSCRREGEIVSLSIRDFGKGFDPSVLRDSTGIGLASMRERVRSIGGTLAIHSTITQGTEVIAKVSCLAEHAPTRIRSQPRIKKLTFISIEYVLERSETPSVPQVVPTKQVQMYHAARGSVPFTAIGCVRVHGA